MSAAARASVPTEFDAAAHQSVDIVDADHHVAAHDRSTDVGLRALAREQAAVDAVAGRAGDVADGPLPGFDRPVRDVAPLAELPAEKLGVEVDRALRLRRVDLEMDDQVRHGTPPSVTASCRSMAPGDAGCVA